MHQLDSAEVSFDANLVVDFAKTGNLSLLNRLFERRAVLSDFVVAELQRANMEWKEPSIVPLQTDAELQLLDDIRRNNRQLGMGEIGAITVARLRGSVVATNDRQARRAGGELGLAVTGSLAILLYAVGRREISGDEALRILQEMILAGAWLSGDLVEDFERQLRRV